MSPWQGGTLLEGRLSGRKTHCHELVRGESRSNFFISRATAAFKILTGRCFDCFSLLFSS
jgi:hypothetical protein